MHQYFIVNVRSIRQGFDASDRDEASEKASQERFFKHSKVINVAQKVFERKQRRREETILIK